MYAKRYFIRALYQACVIMINNLDFSLKVCKVLVTFSQILVIQLFVLGVGEN